MSAYILYPNELITGATESRKPDSDLHRNLLLDFDKDGRLKTRIYDTRENFSLSNFKFLSRNTPFSAPSYGVCITQLINTLC